MSSCGLDHLPRCNNTHLVGCTTCSGLQRMFKCAVQASQRLPNIPRMLCS